MSERQVSILRRMPVFGGLKSVALEMILDQSDIVSRLTGQYFFHEGDPGDSLFVLEVGQIVVEKNWQGQTVELGRLGVGDCFGEMSLIDLQPRSAGTKATEDCQAIQISRKTLHQLFQLDLEQYAIIMMNMGREVSRRLRLADERLFAYQQQHPMSTPRDILVS